MKRDCGAKQRRDYEEGPLEVAMREARLHKRCKRQRQKEAGSAQSKGVKGRAALGMGISIREV